MDVYQLVAVLIGLIAGAGLQAGTGWITDWRTEKRTHREWLRERRYEAYTELVLSARAYSQALESGIEAESEARNAFKVATERARMVSDDWATVRCGRFHVEFSDELGTTVAKTTKRSNLITQLQQDLRPYMLSAGHKNKKHDKKELSELWARIRAGERKVEAFESAKGNDNVTVAKDVRE